MNDICECEGCLIDGGRRGLDCICFEELCPNCGSCPMHCDCDEEEREMAWNSAQKNEQPQPRLFSSNREEWP